MYIPPSYEKTILIVSSGTADQEYLPVIENLQARGYAVDVYDSDSVLGGKEEFYLNIDSHGELIVQCDEKLISPETVCAGWYRKPDELSFLDSVDDKAQRLLLHDEIKQFHKTIWSLYPEEVWLNAPNAMQKAASKLQQLRAAHSVGFTIPETVIGNDWESIRQKMFEDEKFENIIVKMIRGVIVDNNEEKTLPTTILDEEAVERLSKYTVPFPGIYQPFIEKEREWRVTVIGDEVFPAAIYTDDEAKNDWRKHLLTDSVTFTAESMPNGVGEKCVKYLGKVGLKFGAFDLVETPDGEVVFLECNPNGQYMWVEQKLGLPISEAIAGELAKIADLNLKD